MSDHLKDNVSIPVKSVVPKKAIDKYSIEDLLGDDTELDFQNVKKFDIVEKKDVINEIEVDIVLDENPVKDFDSEPDGSVVTGLTDLELSSVISQDEIDIEELKEAAITKIEGDDDDTALVQPDVIEEPIVEKKEEVKPQPKKRTIPKKKPADVIAVVVDEVKHAVKEPVVEQKPIVEEPIVEQKPVILNDIIVNDVPVVQFFPKSFEDNTPTVVQKPAPQSIAIEEEAPEVKVTGISRLNKLNANSFEYILKTN